MTHSVELRLNLGELVYKKSEIRLSSKFLASLSTGPVSGTKMDSLTSLPQNAAQASTFMSPASLSFPGNNLADAQSASSEKGKETESSGTVAEEGSGWKGVSGIVPTLQ